MEVERINIIKLIYFRSRKNKKKDEEKDKKGQINKIFLRYFSFHIRTINHKIIFFVFTNNKKSRIFLFSHL